MKPVHLTPLVLLLLPVLAMSQKQVPPQDELGILAWETMQKYATTLEPPISPQTSTTYTTSVDTAGGKLSITFGASAGARDWELQSYSWRHADHADHADQDIAITSNTDAPVQP